MTNAQLGEIDDSWFVTRFGKLQTKSFIKWHFWLNVLSLFTRQIKTALYVHDYPKQ